MRVAVVHDWLTGMRGGEYVLEAILELFPDADLFTLVLERENISQNILRHRIKTSALQHSKWVRRHYRHFLPILPTLINQFDVRDYDLVISSSHCVAKGIQKGPEAVHVSYVHAPMRYMWFRFEDYFGKNRASLIVRLAARILRPYLQYWDRKTSQAPRVDQLVANSRFIADRIQESYGRSSRVVHPFVRDSFFRIEPKTSTHYFVLSAFVPYKKIELAIEACNQLKRPLIVAGSGPDQEKLRALAGPTVQFVTNPTLEQIEGFFAGARAFLFPGEEDFGITPIESLAAGVPVIAYGRGGVLDTLTPETAYFFESQTTAALSQAILSFESKSSFYTRERCRERAKIFSKNSFKTQFLQVINQALDKGRTKGSGIDHAKTI